MVDKTRQSILTAAVILVVSTAVRSEGTTPSGSEAKSDENLRIRGIFESILPNTDEEHTLTATLNPHFGDLHRYSYLRVPLGFRYSLSERWELSAEGEGFFSHGLKNSGFGNEAGFSGARVTAKYASNLFPNPDAKEAIGFDYVRPVGNPPDEITDGLEHFRPYINFASRLKDHPNVRFFWGVGLDLVSRTSIRGVLPENALGENANQFRLGGVWESDRLSYTFETTFATTRLLGDKNRDLITVRPGIIWKVPRKYTFDSKGNWILGFAVRSAYGRDGLDMGVALKIKINLEFKD